jgi:hypothetical protein
VNETAAPRLGDQVIWPCWKSLNRPIPSPVAVSSLTG